VRETYTEIINLKPLQFYRCWGPQYDGTTKTENFSATLSPWK